MILCGIFYTTYYVEKNRAAIEHDLSFQLALTKIQQKFLRYCITVLKISSISVYEFGHLVKYGFLHWKSCYIQNIFGIMDKLWILRQPLSVNFVLSDAYLEFQIIQVEFVGRKFRVSIFGVPDIFHANSCLRILFCPMHI